MSTEEIGYPSKVFWCINGGLYDFSRCPSVKDWNEAWDQVESLRSRFKGYLESREYTGVAAAFVKGRLAFIFVGRRFLSGDGRMSLEGLEKASNLFCELEHGMNDPDFRARRREKNHPIVKQIGKDILTALFFDSEPDEIESRMIKG